MTEHKWMIVSILFGAGISLISSLLFVAGALLMAAGLAGSLLYFLIENWIYVMAFLLILLIFVLLSQYFFNQTFKKRISILASLFFVTGSAWLITAGLTTGHISIRQESWLYIAPLLPFIITFLLLGRYLTRQERITNKQLWKISVITAFCVTLFSATIGTITGEFLVRGEMKTINIDGTLIWGTIYTFILLPFTTLFARFIIQIFNRVLKKIT
ncbi:MAG: hypothetical protein H0Z33_09330 [Bacillaceae bacterium]|nr:hypothetical protein [Bacillaceae bacterium]